jgi:8-amino-7-oxononanoate synthase
MSGFESWLRTEAEARESADLVRSLHDSDEGPPLLDLAGNDYLGLAKDPRVVEGAVRAARAFGAGARASRLVSGTLSVHTDLERRLAEFVGFTDALVLSTGYHANLAAVTALTDADTLLVSDAHVHASLVDACRLSRATVDVVAHNDVDAVEDALSSRQQTRAVVLVESVYSVFGDRAPLAGLAELCSEHGALLVVDEAHALGVAGPGGRGLLAETGLAGRGDVVATGTLSKALGAQGGVVLASSAVRDQLVNRARPFIYDTGLGGGGAPPAPPAPAGGVSDHPQLFK